MSTRKVFGKERSDAQTLEQEKQDGACPECEGEVVTVEHEVVCRGCGLVVEERFVKLSPQFQLKHVDKEEDKRGLETETPYMLDPNGSPFQNAPLGVTFPTRRSDWHFDGKDTRLSDGTYEKWDSIRHRQVRRVVESCDNWRTDALQDIRTMGRTAGIPGHVCERATDLFRDALDAELAGGRMAFESLAAGALVVAMREADCPQSVDDVAARARTPHERACAGARKVRLGLNLVEATPPTRPDAVEDVVIELIGNGLRVDDLARFQAMAEQLMWVADKEKVGPGTPRATVAGAAVHRAGIMLGYSPRHNGPSSREICGAVRSVVDSSRQKITRYSREIRDAYSGEAADD